MENLREKKERSLVVGLIALIVIIVVLALIGLFLLKPEPQIIQGQAEATQVRVSGKLPGRVVEFMVEEGQHVRVGDTLVHIHSSLVEAKLSQAEAMESVAKAQNKKVDSGTRIELLNSAYDMWQQAQAGLTIAQKTYERMQSLYEKAAVYRNFLQALEHMRERVVVSQYKDEKISQAIAYSDIFSVLARSHSILLAESGGKLTDAAVTHRFCHSFQI